MAVILAGITTARSFSPFRYRFALPWCSGVLCSVAKSIFNQSSRLLILTYFMLPVPPR